LREAFGSSHAEIAETLGRSEAATVGAALALYFGSATAKRYQRFVCG
jgi:hypothetical protein